MNTEFNTDHDILITLVAEVRQARQEIQELKNKVADRVAKLEDTKFDVREFAEHVRDDEIKHDDVEKRLRILERWGWTAIGALTLLEVAFKFVK